MRGAAVMEHRFLMLPTCAAGGCPHGSRLASDPGIARLDLVNFCQGARMEAVNIYDAKTRLSQLVDKAAAGEDVVVSRNGKPLVRITQLEGPKRRITFGVLKGKVRIAADFDAPLPSSVLAAFEGR